MNTIAIIENWEGRFKKTSFETLSYSKKIANKSGLKLIALTFGSSNPDALIKYGADKIINVENLNFEKTSNIILANVAAKIIEENNGNAIIISNTNTGKSISPLLASKLNIGLITNAISEPESHEPLIVKCKAFSSKAYVKYQSNYTSNIITLLPNSIGEIVEELGDGEIINNSYEYSDINNSINIINRSTESEKIALPDAEIVVSAGRGLKGPENWKMIEDLANVLDAGTACSKPVSDMGWRPHS